MYIKWVKLSLKILNQKQIYITHLIDENNMKTFEFSSNLRFP